MKFKNYLAKFAKYLTDKNYRFLINASRGKYDKMSDKEYLEKKFLAKIGYPLDLDNPKTFNEKLQWLKLYNRKAEYTVMVDKYLARDYVAGVIGEEYLIPLIGQWDRAEDIDFDKLPDKFVLKCNHNSGLGMYICKDKSKLTRREIKVIRKNLTKGLRQDYYLTGREWPYKNVPRKIIAEKYMEDKETGELRDYKFFCFDGEPKALFVATDRQAKNKETCFDFFDIEYNHLPIINGHPNAQIPPRKPRNFDKMAELARRLSANIPHVRIDFYEVNGKVYFGEITFYQNSGFIPVYPKEWDKKLGDWIDLTHLTGN